MYKGRLQWYNVGNNVLQAGSRKEAIRIEKQMKAFEKKQKIKEENPKNERK